MRPLIRALSAVLILLAIALVSALITMRFAIHGAEVRVPALTGRTLSEAVAELHRRGLEAGIDGHFYSTTQTAGHVLTQSPPPDTLVRKSWPVRVTISLGAQRVAIPQLTAMDESMATITILRSGLQMGDVVKMPYAYAPENTIVTQSPEAQATDVESPRVSLLIAQPAEEEQAASVMPDFTGESFSTAVAAILHAGFQLAPLSSAPAAAMGLTQTSPTPVSGTVIAQSPAAGSRIAAGAMIHLTVQP